jgi:hypothetical protein
VKKSRPPKADQIQELAPFRRNAINRRFTEAVNKAVASAQAAYNFSPGSYTAQAISDVRAVQTLCGWLDDLGDDLGEPK